MGAAGSSKKDSKVSAQDKSILKVKLLRDTVKLYQKKVENSIQYEQDLALQLLQRGQRERAKCILRKQLILLEHLKTTDGHLELLEGTVNALETSRLQSKIYEGLRAGNLALKRANEVLNIKNVELILEDTAQAIEKQEEINKMVNVLGMAKSIESFDLELDKELETLLDQSCSTVVLVDTSKDGSSKDAHSTSNKSSLNYYSSKLKSKKKDGLDQLLSTEPSTSCAVKEKKKASKKANKTSKPAVVLPAKTKEVGITIYN